MPETNQILPNVPAGTPGRSTTATTFWRRRKSYSVLMVGAMGGHATEPAPPGPIRGLRGPLDILVGPPPPDSPGAIAEEEPHQWQTSASTARSPSSPVP